MFDRVAASLNLLAVAADLQPTMSPRTIMLKQLVAQSSYPIDEVAIAEAIIVRSMARRVVPDLAFRVAPSPPQVRSFRHHGGARSFRLARADRRSSERHAHPVVR